MSHEIRTPINAVLGMNEMIFRQAEAYRMPDEEKERFAVLKRYVQDSDWEGMKKITG